MRRIIISSALLAIVSVTSSAQAPVAPGWSAFAGCWAPIAADGQMITASDPRVCVVPASGNAADLLTVTNGQVSERSRIDADGQRHDVSKQGCNGWESAEFAADGRRLFLRSEQDCTGGMKRVTSGVFAIATNGDWINAVSVGADSANSLRVARYSPAALTTTLPAEITEALQPREVADRTSRIAAQSYVSTNAVIEAGKFLSAPVTQAWLAELDQDFSLDDKTLVRLADAGVQPEVIDVMVAVSNPKVFAVRTTGSGIATGASDSLGMRNVSSRESCMTPVMDPWAWYAYDPCDPFHRYSYYGSRYGYGYGYGYDRYGYGMYDPYGYRYGGYGRPVYIVVRGSADDPEAGHGRMTRNGYTRGTSSTRGTAESTRPEPRPESRPAERSTGETRSQGSTGTASTGTSSSGGSGRTATRKPPAA
jgi:hypothetical protein